MFKRIALALTFLAAFSMAGLNFATPAQAWRGWGRPYRAYYYGPPRAYYGNYAPFRPYYRSYYYGPRFYRPYPYYGYYGTYYAPGYYYGPGPGFSVSVGF